MSSGTLQETGEVVENVTCLPLNVTKLCLQRGPSYIVHIRWYTSKSTFTDLLGVEGALSGHSFPMSKYFTTGFFPDRLSGLFSCG